MVEITTLEQLSELKPGDKIYHVERGHLTSYVFCCKNPKIPEAFIALDDGNWTKAVSIKVYTPLRNRALYYGKYNSTHLGLVMVQQLTDEIKQIREVFSKEKVTRDNP